jgi:hypothetical protein
MKLNKELRSLCFWSWNDKMNEDEIKIQIRQFKEQNYGGFFIHARGGLRTPYMGSEWINAVRVSLEEAKKWGLEVWLYDENGWPSGFGGGEVLKHGSIYQQKSLKWKFIEDNTPVTEESIALYRIYEDRFQRIDDMIIPKDSIDCKYLYFYYEVNPYYSDLLNPDAVRCFIESTHELYYKYFSNDFGHTIKGIFTDEPQMILGGMPWTKGFEAYYNEFYCYSLLDCLPYLVLELPGYHRFRHDFWKAANTIFVKSFTKQLYDWCNDHNILLTGHFSAEDGLCHQLSSNAGVMPHYEYMHMPGIDHLGKRITSPVLSKQVSSAASQLGKELILSETFGCGGWNMNFKDMAWVWGWQALHGINVPCMHLTAYTIKGCRKRDYPTSFSYHQPWWNEFKLLNSYFANLNSCISQGSREVEILVIHPMSSLWCEGAPIQNDKMKIISKEFRSLSDTLLHLHCDFEYGDEVIMEKYARVDNQSILIKDRKYSIVIIPYALSIEKSTLGLLTEYVSQGGKLIIINSLPEMVEGIKSDDISMLLSCENVSVITNRKDMLKNELKTQNKKNKIQLLHSHSNDEVDDILIHIRKDDNKLIIYMWNENLNSVISTRLCVNGKVGIAQIDLHSRDKRPVRTAYMNEVTSCSLDFYPGQCMVVEIQEEIVNGLPDETIIKKTEVLNCLWKIETLDVNSLNIDYARYKYNEDSWSEPIPLIRLQEEVYKRVGIDKKDCMVTIKYEFSAQFDKIPKDLSVVLESEGSSNVRMNGQSIGDLIHDWWLDRAFKKINIKDYLIRGINAIEIDYPITYWQPSVNVDEVFETERNKFFYPVEFESIYIVGNMDVVLDGAIVDECPSYISVKPNRFVLKDSSDKETYGRITEKNLWFYRGGILMKGEVEVDQIEGNILLDIPEPCCVYVKIYVNSKVVDLIFLPPYQVDVTKYLVKGVNKICLEIVGSNRNLLGPHHHVKGEFGFVGPSSFKGIKGWEDFIHPEVGNSTWVDEYNFVQMGLSKPPVLIYTGRPR